MWAVQVGDHHGAAQDEQRVRLIWLTICELVCRPVTRRGHVRQRCVVPRAERVREVLHRLADDLLQVFLRLLEQKQTRISIGGAIHDPTGPTGKPVLRARCGQGDVPRLSLFLGDDREDAESRWLR